MLVMPTASSARNPSGPTEDLELRPNGLGPFGRFEPELADDCVHPPFVPPAKAATRRGTAVDRDVERAAEGIRVKIRGEYADPLILGW